MLSAVTMRQSLLRLPRRRSSYCSYINASRSTLHQFSFLKYASPTIALRLMSTSKESCSHVAYEYIEDVERLSEYRPGGYFAVGIGDEFKNRYRVIHKLGNGTYSTVWLARDNKSQNLVALKIGTADSNVREVDFLSALVSGQHFSRVSFGGNMILPVLNQFELRGPNGIHPCYVTTPARSSISGAKNGSYIRLFQLGVVRALAAQLVLAVAHVHSHGYVHGDIHLGNILLQLPCTFSQQSDEQLYENFGSPELLPVIRLDHQELLPGVPSHVTPAIWLGKPSENITLLESKILLSDFGESFLPSQESRCESHAPISARPPEARFEPDKPLSFPTDIWALACAVWSISGQRPLFEEGFGTEDNITREQVDTLGLLPPKWWRQWDAGRHWYTEAGVPMRDRLVRSLEDRFEDSIQEPRRDERMEEVDLEERTAILTMIRSMLSYDPEQRPTIKQVLEFEWMSRWCLPTYEQVLSFQEACCSSCGEARNSNLNEDRIKKEQT